MSSLTDKLIISPLPENRWELQSEFTYHIGEEKSNDKVTIHKGFITDFASVPRFLWWLLLPYGQYGKACIIHDYLYTNPKEAFANINSIKFPKTDKELRSLADDIFLESMQVLQVSKIKVNIMYWSVRCFGFREFNKK